VKTPQSFTEPGHGLELPDASALSALRAWHEGLSSREAVARFIPERRAAGVSSRAVISAIRRQIAAFATSRQRNDLVRHFTGPARKGAAAARAISQAIEMLRNAPIPQPLIGDAVARWLPPRVAVVLRRAGVRTLADLTLRVPRRKRWWSGIVVPVQLDGSMGTYRAPGASCSLRSNTDYEAVQAWLMLHEAPATRRAYRREAERLMLWAVVERGLALSSLSTEDAMAYRAFLRHPTPRARWIGPAALRSSPLWRPFTGGLSPRSTAYALSVLRALFCWLIDQRYVLAHPFSGVRVRGTRAAGLDTTRVFSVGEWQLLRTVADGLEWSYGWERGAAQRMRFVLDFAYATGLRASELVAAELGNVELDAGGDTWLHVTGKGGKTGRVVLPPLARSALEGYLVQRGLPVSPEKWDPSTPLVASLQGETGIAATRLWSAMKRFFVAAAAVLADVNPVLAEKLQRASPHWVRHCHASHALDAGADLTTVRDNLCHASVATTSLYLHADDQRRARQISGVFSGGRER
jgi:site-specific recombinase XerD